MSQSILKPKAIKSGDCIGIIALSSSVEPGRFQVGIEHLAKQGFKAKVVLDPPAFYGKKDHLFSSDSVKARVEAFHSLVSDSEVRLILSARGGYGSIELLPHINWSLIRKNPKLLVGFSDTTAFLVNQYQQSGVVSLHGPSLEGAFAKAGGDESSRLSVEALLEILQSTKTIQLFDNLSSLGAKTEVKAPLIGGNLSILCSLLGTPYAPNFKGHIVCLEDVSEPPHRIHRMLTQLSLAGQFNQVAAVVLGNFKDCVHPKGLGPTVEEVFAEFFNLATYPVWANASFGHGNLNRPFPIGVSAKLSGGKLELLESVLS